MHDAHEIYEKGRENEVMSVLFSSFLLNRHFPSSLFFFVLGESNKALVSERSEGGERGGGLGLGLEGAGAIVIQRRVVFSQKFGSFPDALPLAIGVEIAVEVVIRNPSNLTGKLPLLPLSPVIQPSSWEVPLW